MEKERTLFSGRERAVRVALRAFDLAALSASFHLAYLIRDRLLGERYLGHPGLYPIGRYWPLLVATLVSWIAASTALRLYRSDRLRGAPGELGRVARTMLVVAAAVAAVGFLMKQGEVSRLFVVLFFLVSTGLLAGNRLLLRMAFRRKEYPTRIVAVVGTNGVARDVAEAVQSRGEWGYHFAGYIEDELETGARSVGPVIGSLSKLEQILDAKVLDEVIFAVSQARFTDLEAAARLCTERGVTARVCLDLERNRRSRLDLEELNGFPLLDYR